MSQPQREYFVMNTFRTLLTAAIGVALFAFTPAHAQVVKAASPTASAAAAPDQVFSGKLCDVKVDVVLKTPGADANPELKKFFGVWGEGVWENSACTALAVTEVNGNVATVLYVYGAGSNSVSSPPGSFVIQDATVVKGQLFFKSRKGYSVYYQLTSQGRLDGQFGTNLMKRHLPKLR
ncbi:hypothetical protein A2419_00965 [Candidatus Adlerbacteria bacterium RIFOXYC1_FULL_48_26]|uniref:Lipoprotein n=1 Tax=Candidatus Adlerbacteria bacterium RIFOXYC1_FULL_48_26 TaxID=1797247 RepID=A0A1F4Y2T6_9BACT|nr:MAG: hypothetical protein A2419_00965 [Candidatus Adlerbacteria bacterium RIFOXYC1_FULL_48_26]OGC96521.1 MAG: hypothetical protein A2590_02360 [Candidatus Adlerbacteria bacterium RIFOXYD1_FULL_48_8]